MNEGALDTIFSVYKQLLPQMGGYLIQDGRLQHQRLERLLAKLAELELDTLEQRASVSHCSNWKSSIIQQRTNLSDLPAMQHYTAESQGSQ